MASVEMCGRNKNLKSSCDYLFGMADPQVVQAPAVK